MKRLIIDSKKMTPEIMALVKEKYPDGYYEDDIIVFKNHKNETIEAIQVETEDTIYLIKIGKYLSVGLENFEMDEDVDPDAAAPEIEGDEEEDDDYQEKAGEDDEDSDSDDEDEEDGDNVEDEEDEDDKLPSDNND